MKKEEFLKELILEEIAHFYALKKGFMDEDNNDWDDLDDEDFEECVFYSDIVTKSKKPFHGYNKKKHARSGGLNAKYRAKLNRETGSKLKAPVTESNPKGKRKGRKASFCARMSGVKGPTSKDGKLTPKGAALKRWKCAMKSFLIEQAEEMVLKGKSRCWEGYEPTPGKKPYSPGSCRPKGKKK